MRILPRSAKGTWLLAVAVWVGLCTWAWLMLPFVSRAEFYLPAPTDTPDSHRYCHILAVRPEAEEVVVADGLPVFCGNELYPYRYAGPIRVFDWTTGRERRQFIRPDSAFHEIHASPDGRWLILVGSQGGEARDSVIALNLDSGRISKLPDAPVYLPRAELAFLPDHVIYGCIDKSGRRVRLWNLMEERDTAAFPDGRETVAVGGGLLAFVTRESEKSTIRVVERDTLRAVAAFETELRPIGELQFSEDGTRLAARLWIGGATPNNWMAKCWEVGTGRELLSIPNVEQMRFLTDGQSLVTWPLRNLPTQDGPTIWDVAAGQRRAWQTLNVSLADARLVWTDDPRGRYSAFLRFRPNPWEVWRARVETIGVHLGSRLPEDTISDLVDLKSGQPVVTIAADLSGAVWSQRGDCLATLKSRNDETEPYRLQIWDIPPRKPLTWFALAAAVLALPLAGLAWRRVRRLRREVA